MKEFFDNFKAAYRQSVLRRGLPKTWWLIVTSPFRFGWLLIGMMIHGIGAFMLGDYHQ